VRGLVTHELGHVLGLARHSDEPRDLMYGGELTTAVPGRRDQASVQVLYQMPPDVVP
jgi:predicted Zn-dependent protease